MAYNRKTDFLALLRDDGTGPRFERMPGLDWLMSGLAAIGMFNLYVNATDPPLSNQLTTVWLKTDPNASYAVEGSVWLWDAGLGEYAPASPRLWSMLFANS